MPGHDPDHLFAEENNNDLNQRFYRSKPADYLRQRLLNALVLASRRADFQRLASEGVEFGFLSISPRAVATIETLASDEGAELFLLTESQVLLHHSIEVLVRLLLAHEGWPACPWLEVARLRDFREFKRRVAAEFVEPDESTEHWRMVDTLLFGADTREKIQAALPEYIRRERAERVWEYLVFMADLYLKQANVYNSAKHGLVVLGNADATMKISDPESGTSLALSGTGLEPSRYLTSTVPGVGLQ